MYIISEILLMWMEMAKDFVLYVLTMSKSKKLIQTPFATPIIHLNVQVTLMETPTGQMDIIDQT